MSNPAAVLSRLAFEELVVLHLREVRGYVYRLIGNRADSEDLLQETLSKAFERRGSLKEPAAFRSWLFRVASTTCLDFLRRKERWSTLVQAEIESECGEHNHLRQEVVDTTHEAEFSFDVHEHISFCFTCVGRALPPEEQAAVVLRELAGFTNQEAADILGIGEGKLRHHLSQGRASMTDAFEGLCSLVNKEGVCRQCAGFRQATAAERRGPALPVLQPNPWSARLDAARAKGVEDGLSQTLHELLHQRARNIEQRRAARSSSTE